MGTIYTRGTKLWIGYFDPSGKRICKSSGYRVGQEPLAQALLDEIERRVAEQKAPPLTTRRRECGLPRGHRPVGFSKAPTQAEHVRHVDALLVFGGRGVPLIHDCELGEHALGQR